MNGPPQNTVSCAFNVSKPAAFGVEWFDYCVVSFIYSDFLEPQGVQICNLDHVPLLHLKRLNVTTFYQKIMNRTVV